MIGGKDAVVVGTVTSLHRLTAFAFVQQESVELGEFDAQKPHKPITLGPNPHSSGSFSAPEIQEPASESAGRAHTVKSERIWLM